MKTLLAIKTHKKNDVLDCILTSIKKHGYDTGNEVIIADDNPCEAYSVFQKHDFVTAYLAGNRHGIAYNNNRLIHYFFQVSDADRLCLLDNDICFTRPGMLDEFEEAAKNNDLKHLAAYIIDSDGGDGLQKTFPHQGLSKDGRVKWHPGSHGVMQWFSRELMNKIGYCVKMPYFYGGEHSELSNRALYASEVTPDRYPVYAHSPRYIQTCPVNFHAYDVDIQRTYNENHKVLHERLAKTLQGLDLKEYNHHLDLDREVMVTRSREWTEAEILLRIKQGGGIKRAKKK